MLQGINEYEPTRATRVPGLRVRATCKPVKGRTLGLRLYVLMVAMVAPMWACTAGEDGPRQDGDSSSGTSGVAPTETGSVDQGSAASSGATGEVVATIGGTRFVWDVPDPDSESCSIFGSTFGVSFSTVDGNSTVVMGTAVVRVTMADGTGYIAVRDPLNSTVFNDAITIDGNTITYEGAMTYGLLERGPGDETTEVDATVTATCG